MFWLRSLALPKICSSRTMYRFGVGRRIFPPRLATRKSRLAVSSHSCKWSIKDLINQVATHKIELFDQLHIKAQKFCLCPWQRALNHLFQFSTSLFVRDLSPLTLKRAGVWRTSQYPAQYTYRRWTESCISWLSIASRPHFLAELPEKQSNQQKES
jgi:hypothetical protein